jgi:hypothetical protein
MVVHSGLLDMSARDDACVAAGAPPPPSPPPHHLNCSLFVCQCSPTRPATLYAAIQPSSKVGRQQRAACVQGRHTHACSSPRHAQASEL